MFLLAETTTTTTIVPAFHRRQVTSDRAIGPTDLQAHVIIGTPREVIDALQRNALAVDNLAVVVIDAMGIAPAVSNTRVWGRGAVRCGALFVTFSAVETMHVIDKPEAHKTLCVGLLLFSTSFSLLCDKNHRTPPSDSRLLPCNAHFTLTPDTSPPRLIGI